MLVISITTFAQGFEYQPLYVPSTPSVPSIPSTPSLPNYNPGTYIPPTNYGAPTPKPVTQVVTGVYKSQNRWKAIRIKINIYNNDIRATAYLNNGRWESMGNAKALQVMGTLLPKELEGVVEYKIICPTFGDIYFKELAHYITQTHLIQ